MLDSEGKPITEGLYMDKERPKNMIYLHPDDRMVLGEGWKMKILGIDSEKDVIFCSDNSKYIRKMNFEEIQNLIANPLLLEEKITPEV